MQTYEMESTIKYSFFECRFFNNDLIRENLDQKDQIASLSAQLDQKNVQISDMNKQLMDRDVTAMERIK